MFEILELLAILACGLFAGAAIYINIVEHPARLECGSELAATVFGPSYRRAAKMQASLAVVSTFSALAVWIHTSQVLWLVGAILIFAVVPFTFVFVMPTNKRLLDTRLERQSEEAHELLVRWSRLHAVRSVLGATAFAALVASQVFA